MTEFALLSVRVSALLAVAFGAAFPGGGLALAWLSMAVAALLAPHTEAVPLGDPAHWALALAGEAVAGALAGAAARAVLDAVRTAGHLADAPAGFEAGAALFGQAWGAPSSPAAGALWSAAAFWLLAKAGLPPVLLALAEGVRAAPPGALWTARDLPGLLRLVAVGVPTLFVSALGLAGPVLVVIGVATAVLGLMGRAAPALNLWSAGFPVLTGAAMVALAAGWPSALRVLEGLVQDGARLAGAIIAGTG